MIPGKTGNFIITTGEGKKVVELKGMPRPFAKMKVTSGWLAFFFLWLELPAHRLQNQLRLIDHPFAHVCIRRWP